MADRRCSGRSSAARATSSPAHCPPPAGEARCSAAAATAAARRSFVHRETASRWAGLSAPGATVMTAANAFAVLPAN